MTISTPGITLPSCLWKSNSIVRADCLALPKGNSAIITDLKEHYCARILWRLALLPYWLSRLPLVKSQLQQLTSLIEVLAELPPTEQQVFCGSALFSLWLNHTLQHLQETIELSAVIKKAQIEALEKHLASLPLLVMPFVFKAKASLLESSAVKIREDGRYSPVGVRWRIRARQSRDLEVFLRCYEDGITILSGGKPIVRIPQSSLAPNSRGATIDILDSDQVVLDIALIVPRSAIEIASITDYSELKSKLSNYEFLPDENNLLKIVTPINQGLAMLAQHWSKAHLEVQHFCQIIIPLYLSSTSTWLSSSDRDFIFFLWLNIKSDNKPEQNLKYAELLLHEAMHSKLWVLNYLVPLITNEGPRMYRHPWRQELRTITAVLHATYVFLSIMEFYRRAVATSPALAYQQESQINIRKLKAEVGQSLNELEKGAIFTNNGHILMDAMVTAYERSSLKMG